MFVGMTNKYRSRTGLGGSLHHLAQYVFGAGRPRSGLGLDPVVPRQQKCSPICVLAGFRILDPSMHGKVHCEHADDEHAIVMSQMPSRLVTKNQSQRACGMHT